MMLLVEKPKRGAAVSARFDRRVKNPIRKKFCFLQKIEWHLFGLLLQNFRRGFIFEPLINHLKGYLPKHIRKNEGKKAKKCDILPSGVTSKSV